MGYVSFVVTGVLFFSQNVLSSEPLVQYYYAPPADELELTENMSSRLGYLKESVKNSWNEPINLENLSIDHIQFINCEEVLGGVAVLKEKYLAGLKKGLQCLSEVNPQRNADARAYKAIIEKPNTPITVLCYKGEDVRIKYFREQAVKDQRGETLFWKFASPGVINNWFGGNFGAALGTTLGHTRWPATILSVATIEHWLSQKKEVNIARTFFHEGMHWLGYRHKDFLGSEPDLTVDAAECCIEQNEEYCKSLHSASYDPSPYLPKGL